MIIEFAGINGQVTFDQYNRLIVGNNVVTGHKKGESAQLATIISSGKFFIAGNTYDTLEVS